MDFVQAGEVEFGLEPSTNLGRCDQGSHSCPVGAGNSRRKAKPFLWSSRIDWKVDG